MKELIVGAIKIALPLCVVASMFAQGLSIRPSELRQFAERPGLMLRSLVVVLCVVPCAALVAILLLQPSRPVAIGLAILMASPAAPMMLVKVPKQGGQLIYMASLHLSLAVLALASTPLTLFVFSKVLQVELEIGLPSIAKVVGVTLVIPVGLGMTIRALAPKIADAVAPTLARLAQAAVLLVVLCIIAMTYGALTTIGLWSYFVMAFVVGLALALGHVLGPRDAEGRTTLAMESAARHPGLALTIAAVSFSRAQSLRVLVPYLVVFMVVTTIYLQWRKRHPTAHPSAVAA